MAKSSLLYDFLRAKILPLDQINAAIPAKGLIYDLGCGEGVITKFLAKSTTRDIIGVDHDKKRLSQTEQANLKFIAADITDFKIKNAEGIVISDVLHHLNFKAQKKVLKNASVGLTKTGILVIKEIDKDEFLRSKLSRIWDLLLYPKDKIYYWRAQDLQKYLESIGFLVQVLRSCRIFPGSTTLFICKK